MLVKEKAYLSARWRRHKKGSKRFHISRDFGRVKNKKTPKLHRVNNTRTKRGTYYYKHNLLKARRGRKWRKREPLVDVFEEKNKIIVVTEFAGFEKEDLKIHVKDQRLILSAEASNRRYYKSLNLPKRVIPDIVHTSYKNGVLKIQLDKALEGKTIDKVAG